MPNTETASESILTLRNKELYTGQRQCSHITTQNCFPPRVPNISHRFPLSTRSLWMPNTGTASESILTLRIKERYTGQRQCSHITTQNCFPPRVPYISHRLSLSTRSLWMPNTGTASESILTLRIKERYTRQRQCSHITT